MTRYRILCVDDQDDILEITRVCLALDPDLEVRSCRSGAQALDDMRNWRPDLVLLDVVMPNMDGPATLLRMAELPETTGIAVAFVTGRSDLDSVSDLMALGAAAVINKPFQLRRLAGQVRAILEQ